MKAQKILMVCLGNICRSPLAEGILQNKLGTINKEYKVDSAGTGAWHVGQPPDDRSIAIAKKYGIDISGQRARKIESNDFEKFDLIFTMDTAIYRDVLHHAGKEEHKKKVFLFLKYAGNNHPDSVPDPYYGNLSDFEQVYQLLDVACDQVINKWQNGL